MNLLFVCTENRLRSPTAETLFDGYAGVRARSAGIGPLAPTPVSRELIEWAHVVVVMEAMHRDEIEREHGDALGDTPLVCLDIPDRFPYMDAELVELLERRVPEHVSLPER
jgi:predicted protein tyrosine phosphatase